MAHFALMNTDNIVQDVIVVGNENCIGPDGHESEADGQAFIASIGLTGTWLQTSYTARGGQKINPETNEPTGLPGYRKNYASIGFSYIPEYDGFAPPKPAEGDWVLNPETCLWERVPVIGG